MTEHDSRYVVGPQRLPLNEVEIALMQRIQIIETHLVMLSNAIRCNLPAVGNMLGSFASIDIYNPAHTQQHNLPSNAYFTLDDLLQSGHSIQRITHERSGLPVPDLRGKARQPTGVYSLEQEVYAILEPFIASGEIETMFQTPGVAVWKKDAKVLEVTLFEGEFILRFQLREFDEKERKTWIAEEERFVKGTANGFGEIAKFSGSLSRYMSFEDTWVCGGCSAYLEHREAQAELLKQLQTSSGQPLAWALSPQEALEMMLNAISDYAKALDRRHPLYEEDEGYGLYFDRAYDEPYIPRFKYHPQIGQVVETYGSPKAREYGELEFKECRFEWNLAGQLKNSVNNWHVMTGAQRLQYIEDFKEQLSEIDERFQEYDARYHPQQSVTND